ncbi:L,D-transpeptidase [Leptospira sp. WS39.C2]
MLLGTLESTLFPQISWFSLKISTPFSAFDQYFQKNWRFFRILVLILAIATPVTLASEPKNHRVSNLSDAEQIILILGKPGETKGELYFFSMEGGEWKQFSQKIPVRFGRSGLIQKEFKREGDGYTPYGSFPIQRVLGRSKRSIPNLEYTQIQKNDYWSDVSTSKHYNQMIRKKEKGATSLWNSSNYQLFIVLEHNTNPSIPGYGSMIFLHPWEETKPTSGCIGIKLVDLESIIQNLDGKKNPYILIVSSDEAI